MKKFAAASLLAVGSTLAIVIISAANLLMFARLGGAELILELALTAGAVFVITRLRGVFETRYGFSATRFALLAFIPSAAASGILFILCFSLDAGGEFSIFKGYPLLWLMTSGVAIITAYIMLAVSLKERKLTEKLELLLLILALITAAAGISLYCLSLERDPDDIEGWGQLATGGFGIILIAAAILLALCGGAVFLDRLCSLIRQKRDNDKF